ncbi:hypothetical protein M427DRAFT_101408 [Gonapodya prolifera JEL478]|uniref:Protein N-terminal glutamine amidohydrolase n=1 Tax=Gonapodya prolifera (strain JEL478) TaxID=1344416 RepID=A0A139A7S7_GONPJ|nr:hypothetical protein M427DRAFT_101408 [Gonapodya prolifera JEL478]|eukprot:KXS12423.1 hypothetical protein M427DRAFT_101408 [Gonapodya prolifera JEL478]
MVASVPEFPISRADCAYTSCYCEENVWWLCKAAVDRGLGNRSFAVFVSNTHQTIPLWRQQRAAEPAAAVVWDYHVLFVLKTQTGTFVYDLDSTLPFPCPLEDYYDLAINPEGIATRLRPNYRRLFRIIAASTFVSHFASNRSHMRRKDGTWSAPPPSYPPIVSNEGKTSMNLDSYRMMDSVSVSALDSASNVFGLVVSEDAMVNFFYNGPNMQVAVLKGSAGSSNPPSE